MSAKDISRFLLQPQKRYSSVRMQQGRVILDSDWNESERIDDEQARRTTVETICVKGTPNQGFLIGAVGDDAYDFDWGNGSFYLGGLRFETDAGTTERFLKQADWLQIDVDPQSLPARPDANELTDASGNPLDRHDLIYLRGWEQCVTAVEDSELLERALGVDTSVRIRRMRRVEVLTLNEAPLGCAAAFEALKQTLTAAIAPDAGSAHVFDDKDCELQSKARLTVVPDPSGITDDPCRPAVPGGYLGADNQTIRVQLTATDRFIWGYDNASPLYRVQVETHDGAFAKIKFLTLPRDQAAQPLKGQAVEILPWSALLPNQEKVAEMQGHLTTVASSYDPDDPDGPSITLASPVPSEWVAWLDEPSHESYLSERDPEDTKEYFYLRLWTGGSGDASNPDHAFTPGTSVPLAGTGLGVSFSDHGLAGDFWIIAARPNTPDLVVPWELLDAAPPVGPRFFFAPLALLRWSLDENGAVQSEVRDCRERFLPLCASRGCCSVTVGDGASSHGFVDSIEDAIALLPPAGGEICLLPGVHEANARIVGRRNITVTGCEKQTRVIPRPGNRGGPIFEVVDSQCITLRRIDMASFGGTAIVLRGSEIGALVEIRIEHNRILACEQAIQVVRGVEVYIGHNRVRMLDKQDAGVAVFMLAEDSVIERNDVSVVPAERVPPPEVPGEDVPDPTDPCADPERVYGNLRFLIAYISNVFAVLVSFLPLAPFKALGGIQIAAGSERIKVLENTIDGGAGNGITLGGAVLAVVEPDDGQGEAEHIIETKQRNITGFVLQEDSPVGGVILAFSNEDGVIHSEPSSDGKGFYSVQAEPGKYSVSVSSPGFKIETITEVVTDIDFIRRFDISIVREEPAPDDSLAFLYEIQIDRNEIANMGLSGIGVHCITAANRLARISALAALGNPIASLGIHRNHIHDCLRNPFEGELRSQARRRGLGGISLGYCEDLRISANRIERNGLSPVHPACGVFVRFVERAELHHNLIRDNAPGQPNPSLGALEPGIRGGVVMLATAVGIDGLLSRTDTGVDNGRYAVRIHDNVVQQPTGQALLVFALGPMSVCANRLTTEQPGREILERLAGTVLILNAGGGQGIPAGQTLFNDNQTRLGPDGESLTAQLILTSGDLGFDANQASALADGISTGGGRALLIDTMLLGRTLRATASRFQELPGDGDKFIHISLISQGVDMNNTANNQGDHCIFAVGARVVDFGNQELNNTLCQERRAPVAGAVDNFDTLAPL